MRRQQESILKANATLQQNEEDIRAKAETIAQQRDTLAQTNKELQAVNAQNVHLEQAFRKLHELSNFKQRLGGMIIHDLKNPLSVIIGLSETPLDSTGLNTVHQSAQQMLGLIMNILDLQKFTEVGIKPEKNAHELSSPGKHAIGQVYWFAKEKNIQIEHVITQKVMLLFDEQLIVRVLANLLHNAIKFTPYNGNITLYYDLTVAYEVKVLVANEGEGIAPEEQVHIFDPYYQANTKKASTGLGLTFCKMAIEAHNGAIGVDSTLGQGSTFWFTLPGGANTLAQENRQHPPEASMNNALNITRQDRVYLTPYLTKMSKYQVYHLTRVKAVLQEIDFVAHPHLSAWKESMETALFASNQQQYEDLLNIHVG